MKKYLLATVIALATVAFILLGFGIGDRLKVAYMAAGADLRHTAAAGTPSAAVENLYDNIQRRQFATAYTYLNNQQEVDFDTFVLDLNGREGNLRTYSALGDFQAQQLSREGTEAKVRASLNWATAVGVFSETRDFRVVQSSDGWKVDWITDKQPKSPPQVVAVSYPRWDVFRPGSTGVNVNETLPSPKVKVLSQNLAQDADKLVLVGELQNEDSVPAFVAVNAQIRDAAGTLLGNESSADQVIHTLLPGQKSPFRIDFPGLARTQAAKIALTVASTLVTGAGDPKIDATVPHIEAADGKQLLRGQIVNRSGLPVNIPQVLGTLYDASGRVIWVENTYLDRALLPGVPVEFALRVPGEYATQAKGFGVAVNSFRMDQ